MTHELTDDQVRALQRTAETDSGPATPARADDAKYVSAQVQRVLGLVLALAGHEIEGLAPSQIAALNECSASDVTRDLANLKHAGLAEQITTTGRWRLGPKVVQVAIRHMTALDKAESKLAEIKNRYSRA